MRRSGTSSPRAAVAAALMALAAAGCASIDQVAEMVGAVGVATGQMTEEEAQSVVRTAQAAAKAAEDITPEQEYYIGRAVAATLLGRYRPLERSELIEYVNLIGQALAMASDRPETFGGYRFLVLDSDEINAFAAPGGRILVTSGMVRLCRTEDQLAAVLAHEIGHVQHRHGLQSIRQSRLTAALTVAAVEAGRHLGGAELAEALSAFEGAIDDVTQTLVVNGYSRAAEREADAAAVTILLRVGYEPRALIEMLEEMGRRLKPGGMDFARTHPAPAERIRQIRAAVEKAGPAASAPAARQRRFDRIVAAL
jgi:predicted Zn-dependent protease